MNKIESLPLFWSLKYHTMRYWGHAYYSSGNCTMDLKNLWTSYINVNEPNLWEFVSEFFRIYFHELLHLILYYRIGKVGIKTQYGIKYKRIHNREKFINNYAYIFSEWIELEDKNVYHYFWSLFFEEMEGMKNKNMG